MPMDLPPGYEHPDVRRQRHAEAKAQQTVESGPGSAQTWRIARFTFIAVMGCLGGAAMLVIPKAKEAARAIREESTQDIKAEEMYSDPSAERSRFWYRAGSITSPSQPIPEPIPRTQDTPWTVIRSVNTSDPTNPLVAMKPEGTPHDPQKVDQSLRVAKCILESPKFAVREKISEDGKQVVLTSGGTRYTALVWNHSDSDDSIAFWERPVGTSGKKDLITYSNARLTGSVALAASSEQFLSETTDTGETQAYFQKRLDRALDAFDRSSKCRY